MATHKIGQTGQSGWEFVNQDTQVPHFALSTYGFPILQALIDPTQTESTVSTYYINEGTAIGGNGVVFDSTAALTLGGDNFYGAAGSTIFVRPSAPGLPTWDDWTVWPLTTNGSAVVAAYSGASAGDKTALKAIHWGQNEYDGAGYARNPWAYNNAEIWAKGVRRLAAAIRTAVGKTAAQLPVIFAPVFPYSPMSNSGAEAIHAAQNMLIGDVAFNAARAGGNLDDTVWDRDDDAGGNSFQGNDGVLRFHPNTGDQILVARRMGYGTARIMGPILAPTGNRIYAGRGPRCVYAQWQDANTIDVVVEHDGGNDLVLPASPAAGWRVTYGGATVMVSNVAKVNGRRLRLTLATACDIPAAIRVFYTWGAARIIPTPAVTGSQGTGAVYDNASSWDAKAIPAAITGDARLDFPLHRTPPGGLVVSTAVPSNRLFLPL